MERRLIAAGRGAGLGFVVLLFALLVWKVAHRPPGAAFVDEVRKGSAPLAPKLDLPVLTAGSIKVTPRLRAALDAGQVNVDDLAGRPVILNFFQSYCPPCREEAPLLARKARELAGIVVFVGVAPHDWKSDARRFVSRSGTTYTTLVDGPGRTLERWGLTGVPETFVISPSGHVVDHVIGRLTEQKMAQVIAAATAASRTDA